MVAADGDPLSLRDVAWSCGAVILDMDGLMLDTEVLYRSAWQEAARQHGARLSDAMYAELVGLGRLEAEAQVSRWFGPTFPLQDFSATWERLWTKQTVSAIPTKSGLSELLDWIDAQRLPMAVATSTEADYAAMSLAKAGVGGRVACLVTGDQVAARKPAPDLYLEAARRLAVPAESCVAIEDSDAGIAAAHAAGMRSIMVPDLRPPSTDSVARAWKICASLHQVRAVLDRDVRCARLPASVQSWLRRLCRWAQQRGDVRAVVLVGSYARGQATAASDVDVVVVVDDPGCYIQDTRWLTPLAVMPVATEVYGMVTSLRCRDDGLEVELTIAPREWAALPLDGGTREVALGGYVVLVDRNGSVSAALETCR